MARELLHRARLPRALADALTLLQPPSQCEVCRQWGTRALCSDCIARYAAPLARCRRCGLRLGLSTPACGACLRETPPFERTVCVADYGFPWDRLITEFKFEGRVELAGVLAEVLADVLAEGRASVRADGLADGRADGLAQRPHETPTPGDAPAVSLVLPVPLSASRLAERGYNQAWEIACRLAARAGLPARADLLLRPWDTAHQADLGRSERQLNLRTAFMVDARQRAALQGRCVALVDDVMTTGATAREAAAALLRGGASAVHVWVIARTADH